MDKAEIEEIVGATVASLRDHGGVCCGGLSKEEVEKVKGWTHDGGFTKDQMDGLKHFADTLSKGKKYFLIGAGVVAILALRDAWGVVVNFIQSLRFD